MSLSTESLRREIGERRDRVVRLQHQVDNHRTCVEQLHQQLADEQEALSKAEALIIHERAIIEALQNAYALLVERLPTPVAGVTPPVIKDVIEDIVNDAVVVSDAPEPEQPQLPPPPSAKGRERRPGHGQRNYLESKIEPQQRTRTGSPRSHSQAPKRNIVERAAELDLGLITQKWRDRAELVLQILKEHQGPMTQIDIVGELTALMDCNPKTASTITSSCMTILFKLGRIQSTNGKLGRNALWKVVPPEAASAGLGVDLDSFEGRTTKWPVPSSVGPNERIVQESSAIEQGKHR